METPFFTDLTIHTYWARTNTPGLSGQDTSYRTQFDYAGDRYGVQLGHLAVGSNFNPEVGFVRRPDIRRSNAEFRFSPRLDSSELIRKLSWTGGLTYVENGAGQREARDIEGEFAFEELAVLVRADRAVPRPLLFFFAERETAERERGWGRSTRRETGRARTPFGSSRMATSAASARSARTSEITFAG